MAIKTHQNKTTYISDNILLLQNASSSSGIVNSYSINSSQSSNSPRHRKMIDIQPSKPYKNFYKEYHSYIAVIFISLVLAIIACSVIYVGLRKRKLKQLQKQKLFKKESKKVRKRPLSRQGSQSAFGNYESFSSRRSNNRHARLTSQRSWADSPLSGIDSPLYEEILNKSLPSAMTSVGGFCDTPPFGHHDCSFVSDDTASSSSELAKFCREQQVLSPAFDIRSESMSPDSVLENSRHHIPLTKLEASGRGIVVQISSMDLISTAIPRSPFSKMGSLKSTPSSMSSSPSSSSKSSKENISKSLEVKPMVPISE